MDQDAFLEFVELSRASSSYPEIVMIRCLRGWIKRVLACDVDWMGFSARIRLSVWSAQL